MLLECNYSDAMSTIEWGRDMREFITCLAKWYAFVLVSYLGIYEVFIIAIRKGWL